MTGGAGDRRGVPAARALFLPGRGDRPGFGGKRGGATASGLIDAVGYLGGALAGVGTARVAGAMGWRGAFLILAVIAWLSGAAAAAFLIGQRRPAGGLSTGAD